MAQLQTTAVTGSLTVTGNITAQTLVVQTITSSVSWITGSTQFGSTTANTHQFTGSILQSGSLATFAGNVGIGTTNPLSKFQVRTTTNQNFRISAGTNLEVASINDADSAYVPLTFRASNFDFQNGNVGIGTTSPSRLLHVAGYIHTDGNINIKGNNYELLFASSSIANASIGTDNSHNIGRADTTGYHVLDSVAGDFVMGAVNGGLTFGTSNSLTYATARMRINNVGNVGIGTTSPTGKLHVRKSAASITPSSVGDLLVLEDTENGISILSSTAGAGYLIFGDTADSDVGQIIYDHSANSMNFWTNAGERMRITSGGIVSVGATDGLTTSTYAGKLAVYTTGGANLTIGGGSNTTNTVMSRFITVNTNNGNSGNESANEFYGITSIESALTTATSNAGSNSGGYIMFKTKGDAGALTERMRILSNGNVGINTTAPEARFHVSSGVSEAGFLSRNATGTTSPITQLHIQSSGNEPGLAITSTATGGRTYRIFNNPAWATGSLQIYDTTADASRIYINSVGNVGIDVGNTNPAYKLDIAGSLRSTTSAYFATTSGNVGIGLTSPSAKLHLYQSSAHVYQTIESDNGYNTYINYRGYSGGISFGRDGGTGFFRWNNAVDFSGAIMVLTTGGSLGIGTTSPASQLEVVNSISSTTSTVGLIRNSYNNYDTNPTVTYPVLSISRDGKTGITYSSTVAFGISRYEDSSVNARTQLDIKLGHGATSETDTTVMSLRSNGYVGIGTTTPDRTLTINGDTSILGNNYISTSKFFQWEGGAYWTTRVVSSGNQFEIYRGDTGTSVLVVSSGNNVGIGTTSPAYKIDAYDSSGATTLRLQNLYTVSTGLYGYSRIIGLTGGNGLFLSQNVNGVSGGASALDDTARAGYAISVGENYGGFAFMNYSAGAGNRTPTVQMFIKSDGNVGIGTTSPTSILHTRSSDGTVRFASSTGNDAGRIVLMEVGLDAWSVDGGQANGTFFIRDEYNSATRLVIDNGGNVGIGTTSPSSNLSVRNEASSGISIIDVRGGVSGAGALQISGNGTTLATTSFDLIQNSAGAFVLQRDNNPLIFGTNNTERVRITSGGNVGIGTTSPDSKFHMGPSNGSQIRFNYGGSGDNYYDGVTHYFRNSGGAANVMTLLNGGNVGIGTTSPLSKLQVFSGFITAGNQTSVAGSIILQGYYGDGSLVTLGGEYSNGGPVLGYAVTPSTSAAEAFVSSTGINVSRGAYVISGNIHRWHSGGGQVVSVGGAVTMTERMRLDASGNLGIGTTSPSVKLDVVGSTNTVGLYSRGVNLGLETQIAALGTNGAYQAGYYLGATNTIYAAKLAMDVNSGDVYISAGTTSSLSTIAYFKANGNVGIGTTNPTSAGGTALVIYDSTTARAYWKNSSTNTYGGGVAQFSDDFYIFNSESGGNIYFQDAASTRVTFASGGNVGIGTTSPAYKLEVVGGTANNQIARFIAADYPAHSIGLGIEAIGSNWGAAIFQDDIRRFTVEENGGILVGSSYQSSNAPADGAIIQGNVGIGTTNPGFKLQVAGTGYYSDNLTVAGYVFANGEGLGTSLRVGGIYGDLGLYIPSTYNMQFDLGWDGAWEFTRGNTTRVYIKHDGNVGIGTTSPANKLDVVGAGNFTGAVMVGGVLDFNTNSIPTTINDKFTLGVNGTSYAWIQSYGSRPIYINNEGNNVIFPNNDTRIGIGTTSPGSKIDTVISSGTTSGIRFRGYSDASTPYLLSLGTYSYSDQFQIKSVNGLVTMGIVGNTGANPDLAFQTNTTERMRITSGGNVGIGTTSPSVKLHVFNSAVSPAGGYSVADIVIEESAEAALGIIGTTYSSIYFGDAGTALAGAIVYNHGSDLLDFRTNGNSTKMVINSSGNVGIGTTNPGAKLDVRGGSDGDAMISMGSNSVSGILNAPANMYINADSDNDSSSGVIGFGFNRTGYTGGTEAMRILENGNVGIGSTSPAYKLEVNGTAAFGTTTRTEIGNAATDPVSAGISYGMFHYSGVGLGIASGAGSSTQGIAFWSHNGSSFFRSMLIAGGSGNVGIGTTNPAYLLDVSGTIRATGDVIAYSDARVKDNVETITDALTKVTSLRGVSYTRKDSEDKSRKLGVIAQEVLDILPEVVQQDDSGNYSVAYGNIVGVLIEAIKELKAEINELKNK